MTRSDKYILCIDGGASSSLGAVITLQGEVIGTGEAGPIAVVNTEKSIVNNLRILVDRSLQNGKVAIEDCLGVSQGIATSPYLLSNRIKKIVEKVYKDSDLRGPSLVKSDVETTWAGATACQPGVVVYAGTGSFAYGINGKGDSAFVDPMGALLGDEGSAYFIGIQALKAVAKSLDGRRSGTLLKEKIFEEFGMSHSTEFFSKDWKSLTRGRIAELSLLVDKCADADDLVAQEILKDAGYRLAKYASTAIDRLDRGILSVYYVGGVFNSQVVLNSFIQHLTDVHHVKIQKGKYNPVVGAFLLGCELLSIDVSRQMLARLSANKYKLRKREETK